VKDLTVRRAIRVGCLTMMATLLLSAGTVSTSPDLPPAGGAYVANVSACYSLLPAVQSIACLANGSDGNFLNPQSDFNSSPGNQLSTFNSTLTANVMVGNNSLGLFSFQGPAKVEIFNRTSQGQLGSFDTEMLQLDLSGNLPGIGAVMIRESPTLASLGTTSVTNIPGTTALYRIDSFFDIFTELSVDGGQTWNPVTNGPTRVDLQSAAPEPGTWFLLSTSLAGLAAFRLRRRR
jgi:hypothetical protein